MQPLHARVCIGAILGAHGVQGLVRVKCFTDRPEDVGAYGPVETGDGARHFSMKVTQVLKDGVAAKLSGITDRDAAEALKGVSLYVPRSALPELAADEAFYHADLIGLAVQWQDGPRPDGEIAGVYNFGAGDLIEVALAPEPGRKPQSVMLPFNLEVVIEVRMGKGDAKGFVRVNPPPGLMPEE